MQEFKKILSFITMVSAGMLMCIPSLMGMHSSNAAALILMAFLIAIFISYVTSFVFSIGIRYFVAAVSVLTGLILLSRELSVQINTLAAALFSFGMGIALQSSAENNHSDTDSVERIIPVILTVGFLTSAAAWEISRNLGKPFFAVILGTVLAVIYTAEGILDFNIRAYDYYDISEFLQKNIGNLRSYLIFVIYVSLATVTFVISLSEMRGMIYEYLTILMPLPLLVAYSVSPRLKGIKIADSIKKDGNTIVMITGFVFIMLSVLILIMKNGAIPFVLSVFAMGMIPEIQKTERKDYSGIWFYGVLAGCMGCVIVFIL